jgi:hypothetical protein
MPVTAGQQSRVGFDCCLFLSGGHTLDKGVPFCLKVHKIDKLFIRILSQIHLIFSGQLVHGFMNKSMDWEILSGYFSDSEFIILENAKTIF